MKITSSAFQEGANIPSKFTCDGSDANPALRFEQIPPEAKSLVLIVDDPDAPSGLFTHWLAWNIDPKITEVAENSAPSNAVQGRNDFGKSGYGGPCPPKGDKPHHYIFTVYAVSKKIDLAPGASADDLRAAIKGKIVAEGKLTGTYQRA